MASGARFWNGLTSLIFAVLCGICFALIYYYGDSQVDGLRPRRTGLRGAASDSPNYLRQDF
jgi:hypothetical protein